MAVLEITIIMRITKIVKRGSFHQIKNKHKGSKRISGINGVSGHLTSIYRMLELTLSFCGTEYMMLSINRCL